VITGDLSVAIAVAVGTAVAEGELPGSRFTAADAAGTWRPVPGESGGGPGSYATTVPFVLARHSGADPARVAGVLAARLRAREEISQAMVTGGGYLTLTVTQDALAHLAVRISQAGPGCARSQSLRGTRVTAPVPAPLATARSWAEAAQRLAAEVTGRCSAAAGADVSWTPAPASPPWAATPVAALGAERRSGGSGGPPPGGEMTGGSGGSPPRASIADAIALAGEDAIRFALSLAGPGGQTRPVDPRAAAAQHLGNPAYAVRYAHAHAASAVRQAADLGLPMGAAERFQPRLLAHPSERSLLDALSWFPERVAGAARRRQPHVVAAYLADLAGGYFDWQERCPVSQPGAFPLEPAARSASGGSPPGGQAPPGEQPAGPLLAARLWLADAARTVLGTGLGLLGVAAPDRI
jgi:arginyl-tRNA synthetase